MIRTVAVWPHKGHAPYVRKAIEVDGPTDVGAHVSFDGVLGEFPIVRVADNGEVRVIANQSVVDALALKGWDIMCSH